MNSQFRPHINHEMKVKSPVKQTKPKRNARHYRLEQKEQNILNNDSNFLTRLATPKKQQSKSTEAISTKLNFNNSQLKGISDTLQFHNPKVEFLYLRNNLLTSLYGLGYMPSLKVLDLSNNQITSLENFPRLPSLLELYLNGNKISTLEGLPQLDTLEVLVLSQNRLETLLGMPILPKLKALFLSSNKLDSLEGIPPCSTLTSLRINDNPLSENAMIRTCAIAVCGQQIEKIDALVVSEDEKEFVSQFPVVLGTAVRYGFLLPANSTPSSTAKDCSDFLLEKQQSLFSSGYRCQLSDIQIVGDFVEKELLTAEFYLKCFDHIHRDADVFEELGTSLTTGSFTYKWYRGNKDGSFVEIPNQTNKTYQIVDEDIFHCLKVECVPVLPDRSLGPTFFAITDDIVALPPNTLKIYIDGIAREKETLEAVVEYEGGIEGQSLYRWYRSPKAPRPVCVQDIDVNSPRYTVTWEDVGCLLKVEFTPVRLYDGAVGRVATAWTTEVLPVRPSISHVSVHGNCVEGETLTGKGTYTGESPEGKSIYRWYRGTPANTDFYVTVVDTLKYVCTLEDINHLIKFEIIPVDQRGVPGVAETFTTKVIKAALPMVEKLRLAGQAEESFPISVVGKYFGGMEGSSIIQWYRVDTNQEEVDAREPQEISGGTSKTYVPTAEDIGCYLLVTYTPIRADGVVGKKESVMTGQAIRATIPTVEGLTIVGDFTESGELIARYTYKGGEEGKSQFFWSRSLVNDSKIFTPIPSSEAKRAYFPTKEDIGCYLKFTYTPMREDGEIGTTQTATTASIIAAALPSVSNVGIAVLDPDAEYPTFEGFGKYTGGIEGESIFAWQRLKEGVMENIEGYNMQYYTTTERDKNCALRFGYQPVRSDGSIGNMVFSEFSAIVNSAPPRITNVSIQGNLIEGEAISFYANYKNCEPNDCTFTWFRRGAKEKAFIPIVNATEPQYKISSLDVGCELKCEVEPRDKSNRVGNKVECSTSKLIDPSLPKVLSLKIRGNAYHTTKFYTEMQYYGGKEGRSTYYWFKTEGKGKEEFTPIKGQHDCYQSTVNDVGCKLRVICTPVREDGVQGKPVAAETEVIRLSPVFQTQLNAYLLAGEAEFKVIKKGKASEQILTVKKDGLKLKEGESLLLKEDFNPQLKATADSNLWKGDMDETDGVPLTIERQNGKKVVLFVNNVEDRDKIVATLRAFNEKHLENAW